MGNNVAVAFHQKHRAAKLDTGAFANGKIKGQYIILTRTCPRDNGKDMLPWIFP